MSFLTPLFLLGLAALAVPILIHLTQRERKSVVVFPVADVSAQDPVRIGAAAPHSRLAAADAASRGDRADRVGVREAVPARLGSRGRPGGARDIVVLLNRSYSMGYGDLVVPRAARGGGGDRERDARRSHFAGAVRGYCGSGAAIDAGSIARGQGDQCRSAGRRIDEIRTRAEARRELVGRVVAAAQRSGARLRLSTRRVAARRHPAHARRHHHHDRGGRRRARRKNLALTPVALLRAREAGQPERITVTAGVMNRTVTPVNDIPIELVIDGRVVQDLRISAAPNASASVSFAPVTITTPNTRAMVRLGSAARPYVDALPRDNVFNFTVTPTAPVPVMTVSPGPADSTLYLTRALAIGDAPRFDASLQSAEALAGDTMNRARVIVLNDVPIGDAGAAKLVTFVEGGGGLLMALGPRATWPQANASWLPVSIGPPVDRTRGAARLSGMDYGHAIFEPFRAPRSGDFSTARFYSYRSLNAAKGASVLARFDTGEPALVERTAGRGRIIVYASTLDLNWNDLALKPMFLPFLRQLGRHLSGFREQPAWLTIGQVLDIDAAEIAAGATSGSAARAADGRAILTPSGQRRECPGAGDGAGRHGAAGRRARAHRAGVL